VLAESLVLIALSVPITFGSGHLIAAWLEHILRGAPSIPDDLRFFVLTGRAAGTTVALLLLSALVAGSVPAWIVSRLRIAATLHKEVVG
jgi:hypothetical protein